VRRGCLSRGDGLRRGSESLDGDYLYTLEALFSVGAHEDTALP
jgi:hypothetical protein